MTRRRVSAGALVAVVAVLAGCGDSTSSAYCEDFQAAQKEFDALSTTDLDEIDAAFTRLHELADEAPDAVTEDWQVFDETITEAETALTDAGLDLSDLSGILDGEVPDEISADDLTEVNERFSAFNSDEMTEATESIEQHAQEVCGVDAQ